MSKWSHAYLCLSAMGFGKHPHLHFVHEVRQPHFIGSQDYPQDLHFLQRPPESRLFALRNEFSKCMMMKPVPMPGKNHEGQDSLPGGPESPRLRSEDKSSAQRPRGPEVSPLGHG